MQDIYMPNFRKMPLTKEHSVPGGREDSAKYSYLLHVILTVDPEARVRFPALPEKKIVGLEQGPLSLVSTTEELLIEK
jgi:hypothetical protein